MDAATETRTAPTIETLKTHARAQSTATLIEAVTIIGGGHTVGPEAKLARAVMLDVIEEREGEALVDELMDALGM